MSDDTTKQIAKPTYEIVSELFGDSGDATLAEISDMVKYWEYEGWELEAETSGDEVRVYATRIDDDSDTTPSRHQDWVMITRSYGYLTVTVCN